MPSFDLQSRVLPVSKTAGFRMEDYWVWDGSVIKGEDGRWHLFASRWPKEAKMHPGWLFLSEIIRASSDNLEGPYTFEEVVLEKRDPCYFDGSMTHNPSIRKVGDTYLLFYIGVSYGVHLPKDLSKLPIENVNGTSPWLREVWLRKRTGLATSKSVFGPWTRRDTPILMPRPNQWDRGTTSNPSPFVMPDGSIYLAYKSSCVLDGVSLVPFNIGIARADAYDQPFERVTHDPIVPLPHPDSFVEDPFLWHDDNGFHIIMKDLNGHVVGDKGSGLYMHSPDARHWELGSPPLAYTRELKWSDGDTEEVGQFERPQLLFDESGNMTHLLGATARSEGNLQGVTDTWITIAPLKP